MKILFKKINLPPKAAKNKHLILKIYFIYIFIIASFFAAYMYWGNTAIQVTSITVADKNIPDGFDGYKIVQISDLQNVSFGEKQCDLLKIVKDLSPDMIAVTGDLLDSYNPSVEKAMDLIRGAVEVAPVYYVTGNHEKRTPKNYKSLKEQMQNLGVTVLENKVTKIERNGSSVNVIGVNDPMFMTNKSTEENKCMKEELQKLTAEANEDYSILLSHRPEKFDIYCSLGLDLVLSGHAHGGQIRLPFIGGLFAPNQGLFPQYTAGLYESGNTKMIVSRGLGNSTWRLRINNRPNLVLITLKSESL